MTQKCGIPHARATPCHNIHTVLLIKTTSPKLPSFLLQIVKTVVPVHQMNSVPIAKQVYYCIYVLTMPIEDLKLTLNNTINQCSYY